MNRRKFLKLSGLGIGAACPWLAASGGAQTTAYPGPFWVFVTAAGGFDPRFMFDPVLDPEQNRLYTEVGKLGNISFAPLSVDLASMGLDETLGYEQYLLSNEQFLMRFGPRLTVLNGVDTSTNNHDTGKRTVLSGINPEGYPSIGALIAATHAPTQPIPFISAGGYDATAGLVPLARITNPGALRNIAFPNVVYPQNTDSEQYHSAATYDRIRRFQTERLAVMRDAQRLPRLKKSMQELESARLSDGMLASLQVPETLADLPGFQLNDLEGFMRESQLAVAAFQAGLAVSANLDLGGFDTHGNHDRDQRRQVAKLLGGVAYLMDQIIAAGLDGKTYVVVASDFARGPRYNGTSDNAGKDHWPITSMFMMGPGIAGDRVIGATTPEQLPVPVDPATLATGGGVVLKPGTVHKALRKLAGIDPALGERFPILGDDVPLFG